MLSLVVKSALFKFCTSALPVEEEMSNDPLSLVSHFASCWHRVDMLLTQTSSHNCNTQTNKIKIKIKIKMQMQIRIQIQIKYKYMLLTQISCHNWNSACKYKYQYKVMNFIMSSQQLYMVIVCKCVETKSWRWLRDWDSKRLRFQEVRCAAVQVGYVAKCRVARHWYRFDQVSLQWNLKIILSPQLQYVDLVEFCCQIL